MDEHFIPTAGLDLAPYLAEHDFCAVHHLIRYHWAVAYLKDLTDCRSLLDIACGEGYGSFMLAQARPDVTVIGADADPEAINYATKKYRLDNLSFKVGDAVTWQGLSEDKFNVITSFDTIEHLHFREIFLERIVSHLTVDGQMLFSTPSAHSALVLKPEWEHHKIEYTAHVLFDFLSRYFARIIRSDELDFPHREVFKQLISTGIQYPLIMNPVIGQQPIIPKNPYA